MKHTVFLTGLFTMAFLAASLTLSLPQAAQALELTDGTYETAQDGGTGILKITHGQASLGIEGKSCAGNVSGRLTVTPDGTLSVTQQANGYKCTLVFAESDYGMAKIMPGQECEQFHSRTCSFFGIVKAASTP